MRLAYIAINIISAAVVFIAVALFGYAFASMTSNMPAAFVSNSEGVCKYAQIGNKTISCEELHTKYTTYETIYIK